MTDHSRLQFSHVGIGFFGNPLCIISHGYAFFWWWNFHGNYLGIVVVGNCILLYTYFCYVHNWNIIEIYVKFSGLGRQNHAPVASRARSQGKWPTLSDSQGDTSQKARRDRRPNWSLNEMIALVDAKREEFPEELDVVDGRVWAQKGAHMCS
jgi:hypothetical protein